jgi:hypothetical protein
LEKTTSIVAVRSLATCIVQIQVYTRSRAKLPL